MNHRYQLGGKSGFWLTALATILLTVAGVTAAEAERVEVERSTKSSDVRSQTTATETRPSAAPRTGGSSTPKSGPTTVYRPPRTSGDGGRGGGHRGGYYYPHGRSYWGGSYWPYFYWGYSPYYYPGVYGYPRSPYPSEMRYAMGGLDLNVKPKDTAVYLDGDYVGTTRTFDGYPGHLWMSEGMHELTFHLPGFKTVTRRFRVLPGVLLRVRFQMEEGESTAPPEVPRRQPVAKSPAEPVPGETVADDTVDASLDAEEAAPLVPVADDREVASGLIRLSISPDDATVYLDGRFLGLAKDLVGDAGLFEVKLGSHTVEVMRPGYRARKMEIEVEEGGEASVSVELEPGG